VQFSLQLVLSSLNNRVSIFSAEKKFSQRENIWLPKNLHCFALPEPGGVLSFERRGSVLYDMLKCTTLTASKVAMGLVRLGCRSC
jgi:hypothetical protein